MANLYEGLIAASARRPGSIPDFADIDAISPPLGQRRAALGRYGRPMRKFLLVVAFLMAAAPAMAAPPLRDLSNFVPRMLEGHNLARRELDLAPLQWDEALARDAEDWAKTLAYQRSFKHSQAPGVGENLWMGTKGWYSYEQMLESWAREKLDYRHGRFPDVSPSGRVVGHYTQMVWSTTTHVGCAVAPSDVADYLVCRYSPPGNFIGQMAY